MARNKSGSQEFTSASVHSRREENAFSALCESLDLFHPVCVNNVGIFQGGCYVLLAQDRCRESLLLREEISGTNIYISI